MKKLYILFTIFLLTSCTIAKEENSNSTLNENYYIGINLSNVKDYSSEYPFKDIFKMTRTWRTDSKHQDYVNFTTDENGWITDLNEEDHASAFLANQYLPIGDYIMTYEGSGEITFVGPNVTITNKEDGIVEFTINQYGTSSSTNNRVKITSIDKEDYIKNIQIIEKQYIKTLDDIFNPKFIENISIYKDLRFMDFMDTNNSEVSEWNQRPKVSDSTWSICGVPLEIMVELCNKVNANPWFCMPHSATDEYVEEFSKYVKENLNEDLIVYVENSNETWNGIFKAQSYNLEQGIKHDNISSTDDNWKIAAHYYAQRSVEMFNIWEENFGLNKLVRVLASQSSNYGVGTTILKYELEDGTIASQYADALAIAPYIGNSIKSTSKEEIFNLLEKELIEDYIDDLNANKINAQTYGLELISYEGGQHLADSTNDDYTSAFIEANRSIEMGDIYKQYLDTYKEIVGGKMFLFSSTSTYDKYGSWGLLEYQNQVYDNSFKYIAVNEWIKKYK